ncbi:MAG TPA: hypothetical protein VKT49_15555 [Bryobacteraceae bacterium]|nr:hypothetical protein [Bryobacteraceae bacterium]
MLFLLCFLYSFFAIVLGLYLGFELVSVRRAERVARTIAKAALAAQASLAAVPPEEASVPAAQPNYFTTK